MEDEDAARAVFRKPKGKPKNARPRPAATDEPTGTSDAEAGGTDVVRLAKQAKFNPLVVGTKGPAGNTGSNSSSGGGGGSSKSGLSAELAHGSDRRISQYDNKAFATNEQDVDRSQDAQSQYEAARQMWEDGGDVAADGSRIYRGQKAYKQYTAKSESFDSQVMSGAGPARAPVHYRATSRFDYQPDICKDYKDTGFCGYGDACKFLHDRSDYKAGWQLEKEWEQQQRDKEHKAALDAFSGAESSSSLPQPVDDGLPFACLICREPWHARSAPVVTKCEHYFCEACALKHAQKTKRCFVCAENTGGIFNRSKALQAKIDQLKAKEEVEAGGEQTDESVLAEYAEATKEKRGFTGGWGFV